MAGPLPGQYPELDQMRSRLGGYGLLRFAAGWGVVLSVFAAILGQAWGWFTLALAVIVIILTSIAMRGLRREIVEFMLFSTPEGQQAISDEAGRMLREMGHDPDQR